MGCLYASVPIVGGWYVMQWAISLSVEEIGGEQYDASVRTLRCLANNDLKCYL